MEIIPAKSSSMSRDCCLPHAKRWPRKTLLFTLVFEQLHMLKHCKYGGPNTFVISAVYFYFYNHDLNVITSHVEEDVKNIASSCGFSGKESCESCPANAVPSPDPWHRSSTVLSTNCLLFHSSESQLFKGPCRFCCSDAVWNRQKTSIMQEFVLKFRTVEVETATAWSPWKRRYAFGAWCKYAPSLSPSLATLFS